MEETIHLSDLWEHTMTKIVKLDPEYKVNHMIRQWVIYNKLEDFNSCRTILMRILNHMVVII